MSNSDTSEVEVSVLFSHAQKVYQAMLERATGFDPGDGSREMVVYEGSLTKLITKDLFYSVPYYTTITKLLKSMGCIRQIKRGGGSAMSQWEMITSPTLEKFLSLQTTHPEVTKTTGASRGERVTREEFNALSQRVRDLTKTVTDRIPR